jgi:Ca-activated chloride channel family protein
VSRRGRWAAVALAALLAAGLRAGAAMSFEVGILEPLAGQAVFGPTPFVAEVRGGDAARVEFFVDGRRVGELAAPPWRVEVDLGQENVGHRFRVVATSTDGAQDAAELAVAPVRVDEEIELPLQQLYVTATRGDAPALDLGREEFHIFDDGREQRLVTFERGDVPLAAVLLIDSSLSMRGAPLAGALAGARAFAAGMAELDEAMLLAVSDQVLIRNSFTREPDQLVAGIDAASARGGSAIYDHLFLALLELDRRQGRKVIVLLSDGVDVDSLLAARELEPVFGRSQALLYWLRLGGRRGDVRHRSAWRDFEEHRAELEALERLVERSGGRTLDLPRSADAPAAFETILDELRRQYVLGYYPTATRRDGRWRKIRIDVPSGITLRAREGYYDD